MALIENKEKVVENIMILGNLEKTENYEFSTEGCWKNFRIRWILCIYRKYNVGNVFIGDALFALNREFIENLKNDNDLEIELEGAVLYFIAKLKNIKAVSVVHLA